MAIRDNDSEDDAVADDKAVMKLVARRSEDNHEDDGNDGDF